MRLSPTLMALWMLGASMPAFADDRTLQEERNVEIVTRLFDEGWGASRGWEAVWREVMADDFAYYFHSLPPQEGLEDAIAFNRALFAGFPNLEVFVEEIVAEGDVVVVRSRLTGAQDGVFLGVPPSGAVVDVPDLALFRLNGDMIVEQRYFTDLLAVMTAIGAVPPPAE